MQASDRFNINSQLEHLQAKYVGTGHADLNRFEWAVNIQRDSYASYVGHYPLLAYFAIAENESIGRERYNFMQVLLFLFLFLLFLSCWVTRKQFSLIELTEEPISFVMLPLL
uniref:Splicing factor subunit n=1 Tax=Cannabis sativa TaxID=3483 RepID=A0A803R3K1_CANSA